MLNINNSIHGLQKASHSFNKSADKISKSSINTNNENSISNIDIEDKVNIRNLENSKETENIDFAKEVINMNLAELSYKANAKTIKTSDEMTGTLINIKA